MWICKVFGHSMVHVVHKALFGESTRVYCKRCGNGPDKKPDTAPAADAGEEVEQNDN